MAEQDTKPNNENEEPISTIIETQPTAAATSEDPLEVQIKTDGTSEGQGTVVQAEAQEEEEDTGPCVDPCHNFHFLCCAIFPPYMFIWMAICLKQEHDPIDTEEDKAIREREREEYFEDKRKRKEEKQKAKEEKKLAKQEKKMEKLLQKQATVIKNKSK